MNKIKIIALFGKSCAGKDTIQDWMVSNLPNMHKITSCTTRPKRDYEIDGKDYYFIDEKEFTETLLNGLMLEATEFNNWYYGTSIKDLSKDKINVGVFNIAGIEALLGNSNLEVLPILIDATDKARLLRSLKRESCPDCTEICRRFFADKKDFSDIPFEYERFANQCDRGFYNIDKLPAVKEFINGQD